MEFCSKYGYDYGFQGSDTEEISDEEGESQVKTTRRFRRADTNIIAIKFDSLCKSKDASATKKKIACKNCTAYMSALSKLNTNKELKIWTCEFCDTDNMLKDGVDEIETLSDVTYLLEAASPVAAIEETRGNESSSDMVVSNDDNLLTFCVDISGSMDTRIKDSMTRLDGIKMACIENIKRLTVEEPNKRVSLVTFSEDVKFYGDCKKSKPIVDTSSNRCRGYDYANYQFQQVANVDLSKSSSQSSLSQPKTRSFVQKAANMFTIFSLKKSSSKLNQQQSKTSPNIDTSSHNTSCDEESNSQTYDSDILTNKEKLMTLGANQSSNLDPISQSHTSITDLIKKLRTEGSTALGPGLVFSVGFSGRKNGSQIMLCTDGAANVGMGSLSGYMNENSEVFYEKLAEDARLKGVTVHVISMEGTDCKLALLGKVADKTNGSLNIVNPLNLAKEFKSILENRIVATNVTVKLIVNHRYLYIRDEELEIAESKAIESNDMLKKEGLNKMKKSCVSKSVGNANVETELTFEYGIRKLTELEKVSDLGEMAFQLQVTYLSNDGARCMRVISKKQEFTKSRDKVENNLVQQDVLWSNAAQKMSSHFLSGDAVVAKYKSRQMRNYAKGGKLKAPKAFEKQQMCLDSRSKKDKMTTLNDEEARDMYNGRKMNSSRMKD